MTIIEIAIILFVVIIGILFGKVISLFLGLKWWLCGFICGVVLSILFIRTFFLIFDGKKKLKKSFPECKNPGCKKNNGYKCVSVKNNECIHECMCGRKYILSKGRFMELKEDKTRVPYMKQNFENGQWEKDIENY